MIMWGKNVSNESVAVSVKFRPYIYMLSGPDTESLMALIHNEYKTRFNSELISKYTTEVRTPLIGFSNNSQVPVVKIYFQDIGCYQEKTFEMIKELTQKEIYHEDWSLEAIFLNEYDIGLHSWVNVEHTVRNRGQPMSTCRHEYRVWTNSNSISSFSSEHRSVPSWNMLCVEFLPDLGSGIVVVCEEKKYSETEFKDRLKISDVDVIVYAAENDMSREAQSRLGRWQAGTFRCLGRDLINLVHLFRVKHVDPPLTQYSLEVVASHPKLFSSPRTDSKCPLTIEERLYYVSEYVRRHNVMLELAEMSASAYAVNITQCVNSGQQIRVWQNLVRYIYKHKWYINKENLQRRPLCVMMNESHSSFPDPYTPYISESTNPLESQIPSELKIQPNDMDTFSGGYVLAPKVGFYTEPVWTFDFSSMYPTVIIAYALCYSTIIFDECHIRDVNVTKKYVPLTSEKCIVFATHSIVDGKTQPVRSLLPQLTSESMDRRKQIKSIISKETDAVLIQLLKIRELTIKVSNNAIYGFLGMGKGGKLPLPEIAGSVTAIGRYLNRTTSMFLERKGCEIIYGDTDSCMAILPTDILDPQQAMEDLKEKAHRWCQECTSTLPSPVSLAVESFKLPFYIANKKVYACHEYLQGNYLSPPKLTLKGLLIIKRSTCLWIQKLGRRIFHCILTDQIDQITDLLKSAFRELVENKVSYHDLAVTRELKDPKDYTSNSLIQLGVRDKLQSRGHLPAPGSRISYVVIKGNSALYKRGEDTSYALTHRLKLDFMYYYEKQFQQILEPTLIHFLPEIPVFFRTHKADLQRHIEKSQDIRSMFQKNSRR